MDISSDRPDIASLFRLAPGDAEAVLENVNRTVGPVLASLREQAPAMREILERAAHDAFPGPSGRDA